MVTSVISLSSLDHRGHQMRAEMAQHKPWTFWVSRDCFKNAGYRWCGSLPLLCTSAGTAPTLPLPSFSLSPPPSLPPPPSPANAFLLIYHRRSKFPCSFSIYFTAHLFHSPLSNTPPPNSLTLAHKEFIFLTLTNFVPATAHGSCIRALLHRRETRTR